MARGRRGGGGRLDWNYFSLPLSPPSAGVARGRRGGGWRWTAGFGPLFSAALATARGRDQRAEGLGGPLDLDCCCCCCCCRGRCRRCRRCGCCCN
jgi:hypothetical protein